MNKVDLVLGERIKIYGVGVPSLNKMSGRTSSRPSHSRWSEMCWAERAMWVKALPLQCLQNWRQASDGGVSGRGGEREGCVHIGPKTVHGLYFILNAVGEPHRVLNTVKMGTGEKMWLNFQFQKITLLAVWWIDRNNAMHRKYANGLWDPSLEALTWVR